MDPCRMCALYLREWLGKMAVLLGAERLNSVDVGSGNSNNVLARHASLTIEDEDAVGI